MTSVLAVGIFLTVAFFYGQREQHQKADSQPTVGILQLVSHPALDQIHQGTVDGLAEAGFVDGENIHIDFQNAQATQSNLQTMSEKFMTENAKVTVGIATPAALALTHASHATTPIILGGVTNPSGSGLVASNARPGANVTGVAGDSPVTQQLDLMTELCPQAKTVGIIYTSSDNGGDFNAKQMAKAISAKGLTPKIYTIATTNDMQQIAETMSQQVDMIYAPQDNGVASAMQTLVNVTRGNHIPVFPAVDTMVTDGGIATYSVNQYAVGKATGKMAAAVLNGRKPDTFPVETLTKGELIINQKAADACDVTIPAHLKTEAKTKGTYLP